MFPCRLCCALALPVSLRDALTTKGQRAPYPLSSHVLSRLTSRVAPGVSCALSSLSAPLPAASPYLSQRSIGSVCAAPSTGNCHEEVSFSHDQRHIYKIATSRKAFRKSHRVTPVHAQREIGPLPTVTMLLFIRLLQQANHGHTHGVAAARHLPPAVLRVLHALTLGQLASVRHHVALLVSRLIRHSCTHEGASEGASTQARACSQPHAAQRQRGARGRWRALRAVTSVQARTGVLESARGLWYI